MAKWYHGIVAKGNKLGRIIDYPTINLSNSDQLHGEKTGVYACLVKIVDKRYFGVLYFGPRLVLSETKNILEIFVLNFDKIIYGKTIKFQLQKFIRPPQNFSSLEGLKKQLDKDVMVAKKIIADASI